MHTNARTRDFCIDFLSSCNKYPVKSDLTLVLPEDITPAAGDMIAVFVGSECRGVQNIDSEVNNKTVKITAYGREDGEQATITYYSKAKGMTTFDTTENYLHRAM